MMSDSITIDYNVPVAKTSRARQGKRWKIRLLGSLGRKQIDDYQVAPISDWSSTQYLHYERVSEIRVAGRRYRLNPNVIQGVHEKNGEWIAMLRLKGIEAMDWVQHGGNESQAVESLKRKVDQEFQRLFKTHTMQRDDEDERMWNSLVTVIDVAEYRSRMTAVHEIKAKVTAVKPDGSVRLKWFGGKQDDLIPSNVQAGDWARAAVNDWFIFVLDKVVSTGEIKHAMLLRSAKTPATVSDAELQQRYERHQPKGLPSADDHPF